MSIDRFEPKLHGSLREAGTHLLPTESSTQMRAQADHRGTHDSVRDDLCMVRLEQKE